MTSADKTAIDEAFASVIGSHSDTLYVTADERYLVAPDTFKGMPRIGFSAPAMRHFS